MRSPARARRDRQRRSARAHAHEKISAGTQRGSRSPDLYELVCFWSPMGNSSELGDVRCIVTNGSEPAKSAGRNRSHSWSETFRRNAPRGRPARSMDDRRRWTGGLGPQQLFPISSTRDSSSRAPQCHARALAPVAPQCHARAPRVRGRQPARISSLIIIFDFFEFFADNFNVGFHVL